MTSLHSIMYWYIKEYVADIKVYIGYLRRLDSTFFLFQFNTKIGSNLNVRIRDSLSN